MKTIFFSFLILLCHSLTFSGINHKSILPAKTFIDTVYLPNSNRIAADITCSIKRYPTISFNNRSTALSKAMIDSLQNIGLSLKNDPLCRIIIYSYYQGRKKRHIHLAWKRMNMIIGFLIKEYNIDSARILFGSCSTADTNTFDIEPSDTEIPFSPFLQ